MSTIPTLQNIRKETASSLSASPKFSLKLKPGLSLLSSPRVRVRVGTPALVTWDSTGSIPDRSLIVLLNLESGPWHISDLGWLTLSQTVLDTFIAFRSKCPLTINQLRILSLQVCLRFAYLGSV